MKTALYGVMLGGALLAAGCVTRPFTWPGEDATSVAPQPVATERKHVAPVRADQVTAENALEVAQRLEEELENDSETPK